MTSTRVLVAGVARSGTSWVGRALSHADDVIYYHEPDHIGGDRGGAVSTRDHEFGVYPVIETGEDDTPFTPIWDMVFAGTFPFARGGGHGRLRPLAKAARRLPRVVRDPLTRRAGALARGLPHRRGPVVAKTVHSVTCLDWLAGRYGPRVVIIQRHPLSVVSSWIRLKMPLFDLAARPAIRERFLEPLAVATPAPGAPELSRVAWHVGLLTQVLGDTLARHTDWDVVTHEALCADPVAGMRAVCDRTGLAWTGQVEAFLASNDRPGDGMDPVRVAAEQPDIWQRRLTPSAVAEAEAALAAFPRRGWVRTPVSARP